MACSEPGTSAGLRNNLLLFCETATDDLIDVVRTASERASVAVACRSPDDQWVPSAFAAGAFACAAGVADRADLSLFASLIIGFI